MGEELMRSISLLTLAVTISAFCGCGGSDEVPPVSVTGKITFKGKPVEEAIVTFMSTTGGRSASGKTEKDGSFQLTTNRTGDGAIPGEYKITIAKVEKAKGGGSTGVDISDGDFGADYGAMMAGAASGNTRKLIKNILPEKYASPTESGLSRTVDKSGKNVFEIDLN
jgi:hypothetical protein